MHRVTFVMKKRVAVSAPKTLGDQTVLVAKRHTTVMCRKRAAVLAIVILLVLLVKTAIRKASAAAKRASRASNATNALLDIMAFRIAASVNATLMGPCLINVKTVETSIDIDHIRSYSDRTLKNSRLKELASSFQASI